MKLLYPVLIGISLLTINSCSDNANKPLTLAISPYQDLAMIVNYKRLKLEEKYDVKIQLQTLKWEEIIPSIGSAGTTVDVGFASYIEYITKSNNMNKDNSDPILFIYPAYIFKGGGFTSYKKEIPKFDSITVKNNALIRKFLSYKIGAQKNSMFDMALYSLANQAKMPIDSVKIFNVAMVDGILGLESGSLDIASAGLTERNEVEKRGGEVKLSFETLGFADITGFICKKSVYEKRKPEIEKLIKIWFDCVDYVMTDVDNHIDLTLEYLKENASTQYTIESYKRAISQEYFPRSIKETTQNIISSSAHFSSIKIYENVTSYLVKNKIVDKKPVQPQFISVEIND